MAWDSTRPVPWRRLLREWAIYVAIMAVVFLLFFRDRAAGGIALGLIASAPMYLAFGAVLAKFGYQRKSFSEARRGASAGRSSPAGSGSGAVGGRSGATDRRPKPPPTRRTGGGDPRRPGGGRR